MDKIKNVYGGYGIYFNFEDWKLATNNDYRYKRIWKLPIVIRKTRGLADRVDVLRKVHAANLKNKIYNKDKYHWGLVNGIIYSLAVLDKVDAKKVKYIELTTKSKIIRI